MGIKFCDQTKTYTVQFTKRHPITRMPIPKRRKGIKSLAEAKRVERELIIAVEEKIRAKMIPSWEKLIDGWEAEARSRDLTNKTIDNYKYTLSACTSKWNARLCDTITTQDIRSVVVDDCGKKSDSQKQVILKYIRCVFAFGVEAGHLSRNPTPTMKFRTGDKIKKVLTASQAETLLNKGKELDSVWYPHWTMALYTGMRNGELHALTWDKVDLENRTILVSASWSKADGLKCTKSGDDRMIPIAPALMTVLRERKLASNGSEHVLPRLAKWDKGEQARELRFFQEGLGMEACRFHDLRATFATLLLQKGVEPIKVMKAGGWKNLRTMMIYVRKAGVDIKGMTDDFEIHNPHRATASVLSIGSAF